MVNPGMQHAFHNIIDLMFKSSAVTNQQNMRMISSVIHSLQLRCVAFALR